MKKIFLSLIILLAANCAFAYQSFFGFSIGLASGIPFYGSAYVNDCNKSMLTETMLKYQKYGIEYRFDEEENLMPHKKYFYAMQEYPDAVIVTADDDIIYPRNWLESLYRSYKMYPNSVSARRVHYIKIKGKEFAPYDHWEDQCRRIKQPSMRLIATGNSGVLYPPHCFDKKAFDIDAIKKTCLRADDIWLK